MSPTPPTADFLVEEVERLSNIAGAQAETLRTIQRLARLGNAEALGHRSLPVADYFDAILQECLRANIATTEVPDESN